MQFSTSIVSFVLAASSVLAQNSICGSQIYTPGTGTCYNGQLCLYAANPSTGVNNIITFPCGTQCYDAGRYVCQGGALIDINNGVASIAVLSSTSAQTQTSGATAAATPVQSGAVISQQSRAASSAAASRAPTTAGAASTPTTGTTTSSSAAATSGGEKLMQFNTQFIAAGVFVLASACAGLLA